LSFGVVLGFAFPYMDASSSTPDEVPQLDLNAAILKTQSQADAERTKKA
jgi:hypothetical protein